MKPERLFIAIFTAVVIIGLIATGFILQYAPEVINHPRGPMTGGDEQIHPCDDAPGTEEIDWDAVIYLPEHPYDECEREDRVLIGTPTRVVDADGRVYLHWFYENGSIARDRNTDYGQLRRLPIQRIGPCGNT